MQVALAEVLGERVSIRIYFLQHHQCVPCGLVVTIWAGVSKVPSSIPGWQDLFPFFSVALSLRVPPTDLRSSSLRDLVCVAKNASVEINLCWYGSQLQRLAKTLRGLLVKEAPTISRGNRYNAE